MNKKLIVLIILLYACFIGQAQDLLPQRWKNYIELLSEDGDDGLVEELMELYEAYHEYPANINDTAYLLSDIPFISDWQRKCLHSYIIDFGPLASIDELYAINSFDSLTIELLRSITTCSTYATGEILSLKNIFSNGHHNLVIGTSGTIEQAKGYTDSIYEGDNLRLMWRYIYKYKDRIQLQISGDKDPGEAFFSGSNKQGFDFYGYGVLLNDIGKYTRRNRNGIYLKKILLGQYHMQFGQGLTMWSGFGSRNSFGTSIVKYCQGARLSGAFTEYGYLQGAAATLSNDQNWEVTLFYSNIYRDATLPRNSETDNTIDWVQSIYNSGYHRTPTEISKQKQLHEQLAGIHWQYQKNQFRLGITGVATWLDKKIIPLANVYNDNYFKGDNNANFGADFAYRKGRIILFGESSICLNHSTEESLINISPAALVGSEWAINNLHHTSIYSYYYSPTYHNLHATAIGFNSNPQNEIGCAIAYQGKLPWNLTTTSSMHVSYSPHKKYLIYAPSYAQEHRTTISKPIKRINGMIIQLRYRYLMKERNLTPTTEIDGIYQLGKTHRHQIQCDLEYSRGAWRWVSHIAYAHYNREKAENCGGILLYQDLQYKPTTIPLSLAARIAWFDVDDYEARLYTIESDFAYQYSSGVFQNEGIRGYLVLKYDMNKSWNIGFKYGITLYTDRDTIGTNNETIDTNHRQQWRIQIRLKW